MTRTVTSPPPLPRPRKPSGGPVVPHTSPWYQRIAAWLIHALVRAVAATLRSTWHDASGHFSQPNPGPVIFATWHNRLALSMEAYHGYTRHRNSSPGLAAMVSASKDGGFLAAILESFNVQPVRGSSSRRGPQALLELTTWADRGYDLAITPDGPRGPRYHVQDGVIALAQVTGLPIVPFSYYASWKLRANSWDRFQIPLPFGRCEFRFAPALSIPREADDAQRENLRLELQRRLLEISKD